MSWERKAKHFRDYSRIWGPGLDDKSSDVVATVPVEFKVALDIIRKDEVDKLSSKGELEVIKLRNFDNVIHDYGIVNTIEELSIDDIAYVVIYKYMNNLPEGYIPNLWHKIGIEDVLLCARVTKKNYEDDTYIFLENMLKDSVIKVESLHCNDIYRRMLKELERDSKRIKPSDELKPLLDNLKDLRSKCSCIPPYCYYEKRVYNTYQNYVISVFEYKYMKNVMKLNHFDNQALNSVLITFDNSNWGLFDHLGLVLKECSMKEIQQFFVDLHAIVGALFVCFRDNLGNYHYETISDDAVLLEKLENWGYEYNGMDKQCESCTYRDSCGSDRDTKHCDGYKQ